MPEPEPRRQSSRWAAPGAVRMDRFSRSAVRRRDDTRRRLPERPYGSSCDHPPKRVDVNHQKPLRLEVVVRRIRTAAYRPSSTRRDMWFCCAGRQRRWSERTHRSMTAGPALTRRAHRDADHGEREVFARMALRQRSMRGTAARAETSLAQRIWNNSPCMTAAIISPTRTSRMCNPKTAS